MIGLAWEAQFTSKEQVYTVSLDTLYIVDKPNLGRGRYLKDIDRLNLHRYIFICIEDDFKLRQQQLREMSHTFWKLNYVVGFVVRKFACILFGNISDNHHIKYTIYREHGKTEAVDGGWTGHSTPLKMLRQDLVVPSIWGGGEIKQKLEVRVSEVTKWSNELNISFISHNLSKSCECMCIIELK